MTQIFEYPAKQPDSQNPRYSFDRKERAKTRQTKYIMKKMKMDDDFQEYLVEGAVFEGEADIPMMLKPSYFVLPKDCVPYTKRKLLTSKNVFLHCFVHDFLFSSLITETKKHLEELAQYDGIICPDPTLSIGGSRTINQAQVYFSRAVGFYLQKHGIFAIPCVRWGDESTFDYCFLGVPKNFIVAISTHGCIQPCKENNNLKRRIFSNGLEEMLKRLRPKYVVVYGRMPGDIFNRCKGKTIFLHFPSDLEKRFHERNSKWVSDYAM